MTASREGREAIATHRFPRPSRLRPTPSSTDSILTCGPPPPPQHRARLPPISEADCVLDPPPSLSSQSNSEVGRSSSSLIGDLKELF